MKNTISHLFYFLLPGPPEMLQLSLLVVQLPVQLPDVGPQLPDDQVLPLGRRQVRLGQVQVTVVVVLVVLLEAESARQVVSATEA